MAKDGSKLNGLSNAFFSDAPYQSTGSLARRQLVELQDIEAGQRDASLQTRELVHETTRSREVAERMLAPLLRDLNSGLAQGNEEVQERLRELHAALSEGNRHLSSTVSAVGDQISGVPRRTKNIEELLTSGAVDEAETVILAAKGALDRPQAEKFFRLLPDWKIDVIRSGLVTVVDVKAEKALTTQQKVFLAQLRRKTSSNPADFGSLQTLAREGFLDEDVRQSLAERLPEFRFGGLEAVRYEVKDMGRDLGDKASTMIGQGDEMLRRSDAQIGLQRRIATNSAVGVMQRDMIVRLTKAGVLKTDELVGVVRENSAIQRSSLFVQGEQLRTDVAMLGEIGELRDTARSIDLNTALTSKSAESIAQYSRGILVNTADIRDATTSIATDSRAIKVGIGEMGEATRHYGSLQASKMDEAQETRLAQLGIAHRSAELQANQMDEAQEVRLAQLGTANYFGSLQAAQMDEAQEARLAQLDWTRAIASIEAKNSEILTGISSQMTSLIAVEERQVYELSDIKDVLREIATVQLGAANLVLDALGDLKKTFALGFSTVVQIIDAVRQTVIDMDARAIDRDKNSEKNLAYQSFQKAMEMLKIGDIDKAIKFFDESENRWPADFKVYFQRGLCYVQKDDPRAAKKDFSDAIKLASDEKESRTRSFFRLHLARLYYGEAKTHFNNGKQSEYEEKLLEAIEEAKRAIDEDPEFPEAHFELATYLAAYGLIVESLKILLEIIPRNPRLIKRLDHFDVFTPLRSALKNTLGDNFGAGENASVSHATMGVAKDCMELGDLETAKKCLNSLFEENPKYLIESTIWKMPEFAILNDDIDQMANKFLNFADSHESEWAYAIIGIALNFPEIKMASVYKSAKIAIEKDPDFESKNHKNIKRKIEMYTGEKADLLFTMIRRRFPSNLPNWLINSL